MKKIFAATLSIATLVLSQEAAQAGVFKAVFGIPDRCAKTAVGLTDRGAKASVGATDRGAKGVVGATGKSMKTVVETPLKVFKHTPKTYEPGSSSPMGIAPTVQQPATLERINPDIP